MFLTRKTFYLRTFTLIGSVLLLTFQQAKAQNCSVNAGVDELICKNQPFILKGEANGLFAPGGSAIWSQIAGPSVSLGNQVVSGGSIRVNVNGSTQGQTYEFRITARCADGSQVSQEVIFTTLPSTVANAGPNIPQLCAGNVIMAANAPITPMETGSWKRVSGPNVTIVNPSSPTTTVVIPEGTTGMTVLQWTIMNTNGCSTSSTVAFTSTGVGGTVNAGPDQNLSPCFNLTQTTNLEGTYAGDGTFGQSGTWTFLSGPNTPVIGNVNSNNTSVSGLIEGTYTFRWTVSGPCANGSDEVSIVVPAARQAITSVGSATRVFCDNTTSTVFSANPPSLTNETGLWTVVSGAGTIVSPNSPTTSITGLTPGSSSTFRYTITNNITGCVSAGNYTVRYSTPPTISFANLSTFLPFPQTTVSLPFTFTGGTVTTWQLISGPTGSTLAPLGTTAPVAIGNSTSLDLEGLDQFGTYRFRLVRNAPGGLGGCPAAFADAFVVASVAPTPSNPGTDILLACNIFHADLAANQPLVGTGSWSMVSKPIGAPDPVIANPFSNITDVTGLVNGVYFFRWLITGGVGTPDQQGDVKVVVASVTPTTANAGPNETICAGSPYKMKANPPALNEVGTWTVSPSAGVVFENVNDPNTKVTGLAASSTYSFTWTITNSCGTSFSRVVITTTSSLGPNLADAGPDQCLGAAVTTFQLAGNAPTGIETGAWKMVSGPMTPTISNSSLYNTSVTGAANGTYLFEWSLSTPGCAANRDTVRITASAPATQASATQSVVNTCGVSSVTLNGNTPLIGTGLWTRLTGPGPVIITNPSSPTSTVTFLSPNFSYTFRWTISNGACPSSSADVKFNISASPSPVTVGPNQVVCGGTSTALSASTVTSGTGLWVLVSGPNAPTFSNLSDPGATISGLVEGVYQLKWTANNGVYCPPQESAIMTVTVRENATANVLAGGTCNASVVQLVGNNGTSGAWTQVTGPNSSVITPNGSNAAIASNLIPGTYTFRYTLPAAGSCAATSATTSITLYAEPTVALAGTDQDLCNLSSTTLEGNLPVIGTGLWTVVEKPAGSSPVFTNAASPTSGFTNMLPGDYLLRWAISNGTCTSNSDLVRISYYAPPTTANAGPNQSNGCSSEIFLNGNTPSSGIGTWTQISGAPAIIDAPNAPNSRVHNTVPGVYQFMWTISNGTCQTSTSVVTITVSSVPPVAANAGPAQDICNVGTTATATLAAISSASPATGLWSVQSKPGAAPVPTFTDASLYNTQVSGLEQGNYVLLWTVTNGACQSSSTVTIRVTNQPTVANAGADFDACLFNNVALSGNIITTGTGTWSVFSKPGGSPDPVFADAFSATTQVFGLVAGTYTFSWSSSNGAGCPVSSDQVTVNMVNPPTPAQAGNFQTICVGSTAQMNANSPTVGLGTWSVVSPLTPTLTFTNPNQHNTTVTGFVAGTYTLRWTISSGGCVSSDQTQITVQPALGNNSIGSPQLICSGTTAVALTGTLPTGGNGSSYTYQWQRSTTSSTAGFTDIPGANSINYSPGVLTTTTWYQRNITSGACTTPFSSNTVQIFVEPPITNNVITVPVTNVFCQSGDPEVIAGLVPTGGDGMTYSYQWQRSTTGSTSGFTNISGATAQSYDPPLLTTTTWFRRVVNSGSCIDNSTAGQITIHPFPVLTSAAFSSTCNNLNFIYNATSSVAGTSFAWSQTSVPVINGGAAVTGSTSNISLVLSNSDNVPVQTQFYYTLTANGCTNPTVFSVTVTVFPTPSVDIPNPPSQAVCNGLTTVAITFSGSPVPGTVYNWTNSISTIGLAAAGSGTTINSFTAVNTSNANITALITVTPMSNGCNGLPKTSTITIYPTPNINTISRAVCTGISFSVSPVNITNGIVPDNTLYRWDLPSLTPGLSGGNTGSGATIISGLFSHALVTAQTATYTVVPSTAECGDAKSFTLVVTINPVADIQPLTTTVCGGITFQVSPVDPTSGRVPAGTRYTWLAPTGSGFTGGISQTIQQNFISGNLTNTVSTITTATYIVTPVSGSCSGLTFTLQIELKPRAIITPMSATICSGEAFRVTPTDVLNGIVPSPGTTFTWGAPTGNSLVGLTGNGVASSDIYGQLWNVSNIARTATYLATPLSGDCTGNIFSITVWVNPVVSISNFSRVVCSGTAFNLSAINVTNGIVPTNTQYTWSSPELSGTLSGSGSGGPASSITGTLSHTNNVTQTAVFSVIPSSSPCGAGGAFSLTLFVNPIPIISNSLTLTVCGGIPFVFTPTDGAEGVIPQNTQYTWLTPTGTGFTGGASRTLSSNFTGQLSNSSSSGATATYSVIPTAPGGCAGQAFTWVVSIVPNAFIAALSTTTCSGIPFQYTPVSGVIPTGTVYDWSSPSGGFLSGGAAGAGESIISGTLNNSSNITRTATYTVTPVAGSCTGSSFTLTVFVSPVAQIGAITTTICSGTGFSISPSNGIIPGGTLYRWLEPSGSGITGGLSQSTFVNSISGTLTNTTSSSALATYIVSPRSGSCDGSNFTLTVTLLPIPSINSLSTQICTGFTFTLTPADITDGLVPMTTTYTWSAPTGTGFTGGLTQTTGVTSITGRLFNAGATPVTATYRVIPSASSCSGSAFTVSVTVKPQPAITAMSSTICSGDIYTISPVTGINGTVPPGTLFRQWDGSSWLPPVSTISGTLSNATSSLQSNTLLFEPSADGCTGQTFTATIFVNPRPALNAIALSVCSGSPFNITPQDVAQGVVPSGTRYTWLSPTGSGFSGGVSQSSSVTSISGTLSNNTSGIVSATYQVQSSFLSCAGNNFTLTVDVYPSAAISGMSTTICSGASFGVSPSDITNGRVPAGTLYTWTAPTGSGFSNGSSQTNPVASITGNLINSTSTLRTAVYTITPVSGTCSGSSFSLVVHIQPRPSIQAMTAATCSGVAFTVTPALSAIGIIPAGTLYTWTSPVGTGFTGGSASTSPSSSISGILEMTVNVPTSATYMVTPQSGDCVGSAFSLVVNLQPKAVINSIQISTCAGVTFSFIPENNLNGIVPGGTQYQWTSPTGSGFSGGSAQNIPQNNISGLLRNTSNGITTATYTVTPVFGSCSSNTFTLTVTLHPQAFISPFSGVTCTGVVFNYTPTTSGDNIIPTGTTFTWPAPAGSGFTGGTVQNTPVETISGNLTNSNASALTAVYTITPLSGGCQGTVFSFTLQVSPVASISAISTVVCSGSNFSVQPTGPQQGTVPNGTLYTWLAPVAPGITGGAAGSLLSAINGNLVNTTSTLASITYQVSPVSGSCTGSNFTLTIFVKPVATIGAMLTATCSGNAFTVSPQNTVNGTIPAGTKFTWGLPQGTGFTNGANGTMQTAINGNLINTTTSTVTATYSVTPISDNCTGNVFTLTVQVQPNPALSSLTSGNPICSGEIFSYTPTSATPGAGYSWTYIPTSGLTAGSPFTGTGNISQLLTNSTTAPITATYWYTITANGCTSPLTTAVTVQVKPTPTLSSTLTPPNIYTGTVFNYTAIGNIPGTSFSWTRAALASINNNIPGTGSSATIQEVLTNNSKVLVPVPYRVQMTTAGCSNSQTVTVNVVPDLVLSSTLTPAPVCSGTLFAYTATSEVSGVSFSWKRNPISVINSNTGSNGSNASISETLSSSALVPVPVVYDVTLSAFGLSNTQQVTVLVQPTPSVDAIASQTICNQGGTTPVNFTGRVTGTNYNWTNSLPSIGLPSIANGNINSFTAINTGTAPITARIEITPVSNSCSGVPIGFSITVLPTPNISSPLTATAICSGTPFNYTVSSDVLGTNFIWQRETVTGIIASGSLTGTGNITQQVLRNLTNGPIVQTYLYTLSAAGCSFSQRIAVQVFPEPVLTSTLIPPPINGANEFTYTPSASLPGTTFSWTRAVVAGITNAVGSGVDGIQEILFNPTTAAITVTYVYTLQAGGCSGTGRVELLVRPNRTTLFPGSIGGTQAVCIGTAAATLVSISPASGGNGTIDYQWQISNDNVTYTNIPGATGLSYDPGVLSQTAYFRRVAVSGDQEVTTLTVTVTVNKAATPAVTPAGPLFLVAGGNFTLTSTTAVAYLWNNSATTQSIVVNTAGGYKVTITDANGCKDSSNLIAVHPPPPTTVNATYIIGNSGNPPNSGGQVTGLPGSTLRFYLLPTGGTPAGPPALPGSPGTYTYYVSQVVNGYESVRVPYTVTMIEPFKITDPQKVLSSKPEMQPDGSFIIKFTFLINNTSTVLLDSIRMRDDLTRVFPTGVVYDVISIRASGNLVANQQFNGSSNIHLLSDVSKMNPGARDSINLAIRMVPNGFFGTLKNSATLTAQTSFGALTITSNDPSVSTGVGNREPTPFEIPGVEIFIPGGFSPNQDGMNDYFVIRRPSQTTIQLEIFNRWGNLIYRSADYKNDWNGRTNQPGNVLGAEIPDGTYYYIINGIDRATGRITRLNGYITLKR
ncbi:MAG: gliding motility-associated C-terminal domain-containing protein [Chitinophagaceae bacterium]|nr:gliding motility-associated C-terminal domain-containing protein [Chitinophagaceae bacterium]MCA6513554.1 gliding motility-associated C-terminal domain-containing protein [Chitinophagaceae bacterium]